MVSGSNAALPNQGIEGLVIKGALLFAGADVIPHEFQMYRFAGREAMSFGFKPWQKEVLAPG